MKIETFSIMRKGKQVLLTESDIAFLMDRVDAVAKFGNLDIVALEILFLRELENQNIQSHPAYRATRSRFLDFVGPGWGHMTKPKLGFILRRMFCWF